MQVVPGWQHDWSEIAARPPAGRARPIRISAPYPPWMTSAVWDTLARAGVQPSVLRHYKQGSCNDMHLECPRPAPSWHDRAYDSGEDQRDHGPR